SARRSLLQRHYPRLSHDAHAAGRSKNGGLIGSTKLTRTTLITNPWTLSKIKDYSVIVFHVIGSFIKPVSGSLRTKLGRTEYLSHRRPKDREDPARDRRSR